MTSLKLVVDTSLRSYTHPTTNPNQNRSPYSLISNPKTNHNSKLYFCIMRRSQPKTDTKQTIRLLVKPVISYALNADSNR